MIKLNLGCGADIRPGYHNVDLYYSAADLREDHITLPSFQANSVDEILALHTLEHVGCADGKRAVARWYQVLKPGGAITIIVPDIAVTIRRWLEGYDANYTRLWEHRSQGIWGNQEHPGEYHKWGYTKQSLAELLTAVGFRTYTIEPFEGLEADLWQVLPDLCLIAKAVK